MISPSRSSGHYPLPYSLTVPRFTTEQTELGKKGKGWERVGERVPLLGGRRSCPVPRRVRSRGGYAAILSFSPRSPLATACSLKQTGWAYALNGAPRRMSQRRRRRSEKWAFAPNKIGLPSAGEDLAFATGRLFAYTTPLCQRQLLDCGSRRRSTPRNTRQRHFRIRREGLVQAGLP